LAVCERHSPQRVAIVSVADCHVNADFARNFYDVSLGIACDIKPAGNTECSFDCAGGRAKCGDACVDTKSDLQNCGGCGQTCAEVAGGASSCSKGQCTVMCDAGLSQCGGACVNTRTDAANCGKCGKKCPGMGSCVLGLCLL